MIQQLHSPLCPFAFKLAEGEQSSVGRHPRHDHQDKQTHCRRSPRHGAAAEPVFCCSHAQLLSSVVSNRRRSGRFSRKNHEYVIHRHAALHAKQPCCSAVAPSPGHSQILSRSRREKSVLLHGCEIKSGSGLGTRLAAQYCMLCCSCAGRYCFTWPKGCTN